MNASSNDKRFKQANREALIALGAYALYFGWWYAFGYGMGDVPPEEYSYVWGLPAWFFYSCIAGYPLITIVLWGLVRFTFKEMPLDAEDPHGDGASGDDAPGNAGDGR